MQNLTIDHFLRRRRAMKGKKFFVSCLLVVSASAFTQIPRQISYQGLLADVNGKPAADGTHMLQFRIYEAESGGAPVWKETHDQVQVSGGVFSVYLGSVRGLALKFDKPYWLGISVGNDPELIPRLKLSSSPYSLHSIHADTAETVPDSSIGSSQLARNAVALRHLSSEIVKNILAPGSNVTVTPDTVNKKITISAEAAVTGDNFTFPLSLGANTLGPMVDASQSGTGGLYQGVAGEATNSDAFTVHNHGTARAGYFQNLNPANIYSALYGITNGMGSAGSFSIDNGSNDQPALSATSNGMGSVGIFKKTNISNHQPVLIVESNGGGSGLECRGGATSIKVDTDGASAADFWVNSPTNIFTGFRVVYYGIGDAVVFYANNELNTASAFNAIHRGKGPAGFFEHTGTGVAGKFKISSSDWNNIIEGYKGDARKFHIDGNGTYVTGSDFAEGVYPENGIETLEPGDVLTIAAGREKVRKCDEANSTKVCGVVSTQPGVLGSYDENGEKMGTIPMAVTGIVPCKVTNENGDIHAGDLLATSAAAGYAMKAPGNAKPGTLLGKAMEDCAGTRGKIRVLVILH
jgi:hypothetical protein